MTDARQYQQAQLAFSMICDILDILEIPNASNALYADLRYRPNTLLQIENLVDEIKELDVSYADLLSKSTAAAANIGNDGSRVTQIKHIKLEPLDYAALSKNIKARYSDLESRRKQLIARLINLTGFKNRSQNSGYSSY
jgi:hypothetical protein